MNNKQSTISYYQSNAFVGFKLADNLLAPKDRFDYTNFPHYDIWLKLINELRRIGLNLKQDPHFEKNYKLISKYNKKGEWKGLECTTHIYYTGFEFRFFQNINTGDRKPGDGQYCSEKYKLMPYMVKKRFEYIASKMLCVVRQAYRDKFGMAISERVVDAPITSIEAILHHFRTSSFTRTQIESLEQIPAFMDNNDRNCNSFDRDKKIIECGQVKYFRDHSGRLAKGTVYHHINNMWFVIINKYCCRNIASFYLFDAGPADFAQRRVKTGSIPEVKQKDIEFMQSLSIGKLKHLLTKKLRAESVA